MKKTLVIVFIFAVGLFAAMPADAQIKLGVKGGLNVTSMSLNSEVFDTSNRTGFFFGPTVRFTLPIIGLGVDVSALYDQRDVKLKSADGNTADGTMRQKAFDIPVNLRYGVGLGSLASLYFFAGPQFGFNVGDKDKTISDVNWKLKDSNFSVNVGAGLMLLDHLQVSANYNIACGTTGNVSVESSTKNYSAKNNAWQIGVAYYF
jgi:opacity protein-like surface antigen